MTPAPVAGTDEAPAPDASGKKGKKKGEGKGKKLGADKGRKVGWGRTAAGAEAEGAVSGESTQTGDAASPVPETKDVPGNPPADDPGEGKGKAKGKNK